jgi:hypothetical protein
MGSEKFLELLENGILAIDFIFSSVERVIFMELVRREF